MKIAVWKTGHPIADTVADALAEGLHGDIWPTDSIKSTAFGSLMHKYDAHIGYGILRGNTEIFHECQRQGLPYFEVDRGYVNPSHYEGTYRISCRGTQAIWHEGVPRKPWAGKLEPWRTDGDYVLICPPTEAVCKFFGFPGIRWIEQAVLKCRLTKDAYKIRYKENTTPIEDDLAKAKAVLTFNSSVGWKALQMGIPVFSDPAHSIIGSFFKQKLLTQKLQDLPDNRIEIFESMMAHQFTLEEIKRGEAWSLINHYLSKSTSDMIAANPLPTQSASIPYGNARRPK